MKKTIPLFAAAAAMMLLAGCASPDAGARTSARIASHLDPDGMEYAVVTAPAWERLIRRTDEKLDDAVWSASIPEDELRASAAALEGMRLIRALSGLGNAGGIGRSSTALGKERIHNRLFLLLPPEAPGLVNALPAAENRIETAKWFADLPSDTVAAFSVSLRPEALLDALAASGAAGENLAGMVPPGLNVEELLRQSAGEWHFVMLANSGPDAAFKVEIPDREGKFFRIISRIAALEAKKFRSKNRTRVMLSLFGGSNPVIRGEGKLIIYSDVESEKRFDAVKRKLAITEAHAGLLHDLPEKAVAVGFIDGKKVRALPTAFGKLLVVPPAQPEIPSAFALSRDEDGMLLVLNSDTPWLAGDLSLMMIGIDILQTLNPGRNAGSGATEEGDGKDDPGENVGETETTPAPEAVPGTDDPARAKRDAGLLTAAAELLKKAPGTKPGLYLVRPEGLIPAGKKNFDVAFFGTFALEGRLPQFIAAPAGEYFSVRFDDGGIRRFHLVKPDSFRRIIGFLYTVRRWDERNFRELIDRAEQLDKQ